MNITSVSSYAEVRAILGVSNEEIEDSDLDTPAWATEVMFRVLDVSADAETTYATVSALDQNARTALQQRFYLVYRLFCAYSFADILFHSLPMFAFKSVTDGKAEVSRFESLETVERGIAAGVNTSRLRLRQILTEMGLASTGAATTTVLTFVSSVGLSVDPVTNA